MMRSAEASFLGEGGSDRSKALSNGALGMLIFIAMELMFFASLIRAYLVMSAGAIVWPPPDQPRLPVALTGVNTLILFASAFTLYRSYRAFGDNPKGNQVRTYLLMTLLFGTTFVAVQGFEWVSLIGHGLTMTSSQYGAFFYLIIGIHALHAVGAIIGVWRAYRFLKNGKLEEQTLMGTQLFWYFVVGVWPVLYWLVYWA